MPLVPYNFDPFASDYEENYLEYADTPTARQVKWPLIGAAVYMPKEQYRELAQVVALNSDQFHNYGQFGFSLGRYHEFFVSMPNEHYVHFNMGGVEITVGEATPLAVMLFDPYHREKYFGSWETISSIRILGAEISDAEVYFLNSCLAYAERFGVLPDRFHIDQDLILDFEVDLENLVAPQSVTLPPPITNLDPLRFFFSGLNQPDHAAAGIYFYKTLEYFSFFTNAAEMRTLRHDTTVSDADFSRRILDLVTRDEKGPVFRLITSLADQHTITTAAADGLISSASANHLCEAIYQFRNSIVHGKYSYGYSCNLPRF